MGSVLVSFLGNKWSNYRLSFLKRVCIGLISLKINEESAGSFFEWIKYFLFFSDCACFLIALKLQKLVRKVLIVSLKRKLRFIK